MRASICTKTYVRIQLYDRILAFFVSESMLASVARISIPTDFLFSLLKEPSLYQNFILKYDLNL